MGRNKREILIELRYFEDKGVRVKIFEIPITTQDLAAPNNSMAEMIMETINNMLIELYATLAQAEIAKRRKGKRKELKKRNALENGMIVVVLKY